MYKQETRDKILNYIKEIKEITFNKLQYIGQEKKQIHNFHLLEIINDLEKENQIIVLRQKVNEKEYKTINAI